MSKSFESLWHEFITAFQLTDIQSNQFLTYYHLLQETNKMHNLTALTDPADIITYHFKDSLSVIHYYPMAKVTGLVDVGSGAGFPALPIKIMYPHIPVVLLEVITKKIYFLNEVVDALSLNNIEVCAVDWRTFLRTTHYNFINLCISRAAISVAELARMFSPHSPYKTATCIYWASQKWNPTGKEKQFVEKKYTYTLGERTRSLVVLRAVP